MEKASLPVASKCTDDSDGDVGCAPAGYAYQVVDVNRAAFLVRRRPLHGLYNGSTLSSTVPVAKRCIDSKLGRGRRGQQVRSAIKTVISYIGKEQARE